MPKPGENPRVILQHSFTFKIEGVTSGEYEYFYTVEGLGVHYQTEQYLPGGHSQPFIMPKVYQTTNLVLKRPMTESKSNITEWCEKTLDSGSFQPTVAHLMLLGRDENVQVQWLIEGVYPIGLEIGSLGVGTDDTVLMEKITLVYTRLKRLN
jgi:phage tail-like protein